MVPFPPRRRPEQPPWDIRIVSGHRTHPGGGASAEAQGFQVASGTPAPSRCKSHLARMLAHICPLLPVLPSPAPPCAHSCQPPTPPGCAYMANNSRDPLGPLGSWPASTSEAQGYVVDQQPPAAKYPLSAVKKTSVSSSSPQIPSCHQGPHSRIQLHQGVPRPGEVPGKLCPLNWGPWVC